MCTKAAVSCIREKTAESNIDIEADDLPKEFYDTLKVTMQHMDKAIKQTPASAMKEFVVEIPSTTFDDIGGLEDVKSELREMIEFPVTHPEYFEELGKYNIFSFSSLFSASNSSCINSNAHPCTTSLQCKPKIRHK